MALDWPAPNGTVEGWDEITRDNDRDRLIQCLALLMQTDVEYEKYSLLDLKGKMDFPTSSSTPAPGLRVWLHTVPDEEMAAFFFLRAKNDHVPHTPAYVLAVGVVRDDVDMIYNALLPLCQWMLGQDPTRLEILCPLGQTVNETLQDVIDQIPAGSFLVDQIKPGKPWKKESTVWKRWRLGRNLPTVWPAPVPLSGTETSR